MPICFRYSISKWYCEDSVHMSKQLIRYQYLFIPFCNCSTLHILWNAKCLKLSVIGRRHKDLWCLTILWCLSDLLENYCISILLSNFHLFQEFRNMKQDLSTKYSKQIILNQEPFAQQIEEMSTFQFQFFLFIIALKVKDNSPLVKLF